MIDYVGVLQRNRDGVPSVFDRFDNLVVLRRGNKAELVQYRGVYAVIIVEHKHDFVVRSGKASAENVVTVRSDGADKLAVLAGYHLRKVTCAIVFHPPHTHQLICKIARSGIEVAAGIHQVSVLVVSINVKLYVVRIHHTVFADVLMNFTVGIVKVLFKRRKVVADNVAGYRVGNFQRTVVRIYRSTRIGLTVVFVHLHSADFVHHRSGVYRTVADSQRIRSHRILLELSDIGVNAVGNGKNKSDTDNTDRPRNRSKNRTTFFLF